MAIYKKLLEFQKKNITVEKDATNPHFKNRYATLNEVLAKVKGPLNELGIVIVQRPYFDGVGTGGQLHAGLTTELIDTSDDTKVSCFMPYVGADTAQKLGSANTYCRRYSLVTLLGLEDEDDDGEMASLARKTFDKNAEAIKKVPLEDKPVVERNDQPFGSKYPTEPNATPENIEAAFDNQTFTKTKDWRI